MLTRRRFAGGASALAFSGEGAFADARRPLRVPDEGAPHLRTFMQWPVNRSVHDDADFLADLQGAIARVANAIVAFEPVVMLAAASHHAAIRRKISSRVELWDIPTDDLWCRDSGPLFAFDAANRPVVSHIRFNGWGGKQVHVNDGQIARRVAERLGLPVVDHGLIGEAGGAEYDGEGTVIAHASSWINGNRNAGIREDVTARLLNAYGARKVIWAPGVKGEDITDYHIDALARFVRPGTVLIQLPDDVDPDDPWSRAAVETHDILKGAKDAAGRTLRLEVIPDAVAPRVRSDDFVASYVNYYVCNGAVVAAQFGDSEADAAAKKALTRLYPGREVVMLNVDAIGEAGGGIHCATQQQPAG